MYILSHSNVKWLQMKVGKKMRWCAVSEIEQRKCAELSKALVAALPPAAVAAFARLSCVRATSTADCIDKIRVREEPSCSPSLAKCVSTLGNTVPFTVSQSIYPLPLSLYSAFMYPHPPTHSVLEESFTHLSGSL